MEELGVIAQLAAANHGVVERDWLIAAGLSDGRIGRLLARGVLERLHPNVYRMAGSPATWHQALHAACLAAGPAAAVSHRAALAWWGLDGATRGTVEIAVPRPQWPELQGVLQVHRSTDLRDAHVVVRESVRVTTPARTLVDLGAVAPEFLVARAYVHAVGKNLVTRYKVQSVLDDVGRRGRRGVGVMRRVLEERHGIDDTRGYLAARGLEILRRYNLPLGIAEYQIYDENGLFVAQVDRAWPEARFCVEWDGDERHGGSTAEDVQRQNDILDAGYDLRRFGHRHVTRDEEYVARTIGRALAPFLSAESSRRSDFPDKNRGA